MSEKWLIAKYLPTNLFSLKPSFATSSGGKTLIAPSPYAIKMAIINALFLDFSKEEVETHFEWVKNIKIRIKAPEKAVFNNCFVKILRKRESKKQGDDNSRLIAEGYIFQETIGFREYIYFEGILEIAFEISTIDPKIIKILSECLYKTNYFGKKGSFFQLAEIENIDKLDENFCLSISEISLKTDGITMPMDDIGEKATFDAIDIYSDKKLTEGKDRISDMFVFPNYQRIKSSKSFTYYERKTT